MTRTILTTAILAMLLTGTFSRPVTTCFVKPDEICADAASIAPADPGLL